MTILSCSFSHSTTTPSSEAPPRIYHNRSRSTASRAPISFAASNDSTPSSSSSVTLKPPTGPATARFRSQTSSTSFADPPSSSRVKNFFFKNKAPLTPEEKQNKRLSSLSKPTETEEEQAVGAKGREEKKPEDEVRRTNSNNAQMLNSMGFKQMNSASEISTGSPMGLPAWTKAEFVIHPTRLIADDPDFNQELGSSRPVEVVLEYAEQYDEFPFLINFVKEHEKMKIEKKCQLPDEEFENHIHLVGTKDNESCVVSVITTPSDDKYRGLLRTPGGDETFFLATSEVSKPKPTVIAQAIVNKFVGYEKLSLVDSYNLSRMLIDYDFLLKIQRYKFGVLYVPNTPSSEEDLFEYMMGEKLDGEEEEKKVSPQFEEFMSFMGDKVELLNWSHYSGDLDKTENRTGKESFYRNFQQLEVMFQVAPLIPKIRRKPIIGNTIVTIVFLEDGFFDLSLILSQVIHVIVVVQPIKQDDGW
eukprot:CAMPEP_0201515060 /NCGR_PEP_ID=MMETSP0161_2-20130828/6728_1 /ASSEMBLY_ACC=CAM_ASM_000251 /TAXON_ID=180227 /ORGANISM="Neoparamoeba aestuarina, Strain SoJaBio B1-5/56/2" /LENGTH=472 /DNA_ID=CAMNT_0047911775 /DNA_START=254 /DNA_END=1669 /DNA_ORIENTATION=+